MNPLKFPHQDPQTENENAALKKEIKTFHSVVKSI